MIERLTIGQDTVESKGFLFDYLYSYLLRFAKQNKIPFSESIEIPNDLLTDFLAMLEISLQDLLEDCYEEPTHKQRSKFPTRYQKIWLKEKLYVVDYRKDIVGKIAYRIDILINRIKELN
ncbi:MAG: hypothetical protein GY816_19380 [Cytophagales bacterium]|nr:hypothetical protein [Cytophagales bacterium]